MRIEITYLHELYIFKFDLHVNLKLEQKINFRVKILLFL